jgi:hypothetical protein
MKSIKELFNFDKSCLFCKYKYDSDACFDALYNHNYHCHSLSNIYHGKIVKWFPFNVIEKIKDKIECKKAEKFYDDLNEDGTENSTMKHIWGLKSYDDLSSAPCGLMTMNDIDVTYLKDENKYVLSIETIYMFNGEHGKYRYMEELLNKFSEFMKENNYDTTKEFELFEADSININTHFDSIEECYAAFKMFVNGFCSLENKEKEGE